VALLTLLTCSCGARQVVRQDDGSYRTFCNTTLDECIRRTRPTCKNEELRILSAREDNKLYGPEGNQQGTLVSEMIFACGDEGPPVQRPALVLPEREPTPETSSEPVRACVPGSTQECVGVGACRGGQACLPDASGFGPCECAAPLGAQPAETPPAMSSEPGPSTTPAVPTVPTPDTAAE
jgi:hypothetical protein